MNRWQFKPGLFFKIRGKTEVYQVGSFQDQNALETYQLFNQNDVEIGLAELVGHYVLLIIPEEIIGLQGWCEEYFNYRDLEIVKGEDLSKTDAKEIIELDNYLTKIYNKIPDTNPLQATVWLAGMYLKDWFKLGRKPKIKLNALAFAKSIPKFTDFDGEEFHDWLINDVENQKFIPF